MERFFVFCGVFLLGGDGLFVGTADIDRVDGLSGPQLISIPSPVTHFSNSVGVTLSCRATGPSPLIIEWWSGDTGGSPGVGSEELPKIPGIREQLDNGSLYFFPFRGEEYMVSVHAARYRCSARNAVGVYLSPVFRVNAVIDETFQVSISASSPEGQSDYWLEGNPALLECHVTNPPFYSQITKVLTWKEIDQFGHEREIAKEEANTPYVLTAPRGALLLLQAPLQRLFVCVVQNTLNGQVKASPPFLFKAKRVSPQMAPLPLAEAAVNKIQLSKGPSLNTTSPSKSVVDLLCIVIGNPVPLWRWEKLDEKVARWNPVSVLAPQATGPRLRLSLQDTPSDLGSSDRISGTYRCEVSNALGSTSVLYTVEVTPRPEVTMEPGRLVAYPGQTVEYFCSFNSTSRTKSGDFVWYKNGQPLVNSNRVKVTPGSLKLFSVGLEDQGVYQCFDDNSYNSAELIFPPAAPELVHTFISQSVQPGPSISLKCSALGNPAPVISWFIDDLMVSSSYRGGFTLERKYLWTGQQQQSRFHLSFGESDRNLEQAAYTNSGHHQHQQQQHHQYGGEVVSYLNISTVQGEDSGVYKCTATNFIRGVSHSARLNVFGGIFVREMAGESVTYAHGDTVYIPCHYGGYPVDKIIWQKDSRNLLPNSEAIPQSPGKNSGDQQKQSERTGGGKFSMFANGTLRISEISADSTDRGRYTCVVSNRKGEVASGSVDINVMHPPLVSSFKFEGTLIEGQRTSVLCNVLSGDLPINISWHKDSQPISPYLNVTENRVRFLSVLAFDELHEAHSGEYTCFAANPARVVKQSATLLVRVSPKWTKPPENTKAVVGSEHTLECRAKGVPSPTLSWFRDTNGNKVALRTNHKYHLLSNGTLLKIRQITESDRGLYTCQADNGVGDSPLALAAKLDVIIPARISGSETNVAAPAVVVIAEGTAASLSCQIRGDEPLQVMWKKDSVMLLLRDSAAEMTRNTAAAAAAAAAGEEQERRGASSRRFLQKVTRVNSSVLSAELTIHAGSLADSGIYECVASNQYGRDEKKIKLQVKARPVVPDDFMVEEIGSRFIRLKWSSSQTTLSSSSSSSSSAFPDPITHFLVEWLKWDAAFTEATASWEQGHNLTVDARRNQAVIENLFPVTNYRVRLFAHSKIGQSLPSPPLVVLTLAEAPSGPPLNVSALPAGPRSVMVRWKPPELNRQHGTITGYHVTAILQQQQTLSSLPAAPRAPGLGGGGNKSVSVDVKYLDETTIQGLQPHSQYRVSVSAHNSAGVGPESPYQFIQTPEGAPDSPPLHVQCEALSPKSVQVHWEPPPEHLQNGGILGYKVSYMSVDGERLGEKAEVKKTSNRETTLHGLKSYTSYAVRVLAYTVGGESESSEGVQCVTEEDVPGEPADLKVVCSGSSSVVVSWLPPHFPNGLISRYTVYWNSEEDTTVKEKQVAATGAPGNGGREEGQYWTEVKRLKENLPYRFWVSGQTAAGVGKPSKTESVRVSASGLPRIASFSVAKSVTVGEAVMLPCLRFVSVVGGGGSSAKVVWFKDHAAVDLGSGKNVWSNGTLSINRVKDADEGKYTCRAENEHGSDELEHRVVISRPPGAVSLFLGYVTHSSIQIHWDPPQRASPPLISFLLEWRPDPVEGMGTNQWSNVKLGQSVQSHTFEELRCGTQYKFRIAGVNRVGQGLYSDLLSTRTFGRLPEEKPRLTEILDGNGTMVRIDLTRWPNGDCPIKKFHVEYRQVNSSSWIPVMTAHSRDNLTTPVPLRVLTLQTQLKLRYEIQVRMENDAGLVTRRFVVESHPDFFRNYAKVLERVEVGDRGNGADPGDRGTIVPFYTDPHVLVPIVSAIICTVAAAVCLMMVLLRRRNLRKQSRQNHTLHHHHHHQSSSEWKFSGGGCSSGGPAGRQSQQSWLSGSGGGLDKCSGDLTDGGGATTESTSIYATLNSTKPIPMTIRDSTVRLHSFDSFDNYDAAPMTATGHHHHNMQGVPTGQYKKKGKRKSGGSTQLSPVDVCMQQVSCQMDFPGRIEPPHQFRSCSGSTDSIASPATTYLHPASAVTQNRREPLPSAGFLVNRDGTKEELYHDYAYPYHHQFTPCPPSAEELLLHHSTSGGCISGSSNTLKKSSSRKMQSDGKGGSGGGDLGSKRGSRCVAGQQDDEYFQ